MHQLQDRTPDSATANATNDSEQSANGGAVIERHELSPDGMDWLCQVWPLLPAETQMQILRLAAEGEDGNS